MKPKPQFAIVQTKTNHLSFLILSTIVMLIILWATTANVSGNTSINTDDGQLDNNWSSTPNITDSIDNEATEWDIIAAWMDVDSENAPSTYFFRIEVASGPIGPGGTVQIDFDCNNNRSFDDENVDKVLNYWIGYEEEYSGPAVWISTPRAILIKEYTDTHAEAVGNNYELRADAADFCAATPFSVRFRIGHGADTTVPLSYPLPNSTISDVPLVLDDGTSENSRGHLFGSNALQFLWFNQFTPNTSDFPFALNEVKIQWLAGSSGSQVGDAIDVYIWEDPDGNPRNGATFRGSTSGTIQIADGAFSTYTLSEPITFCNPTDILIGTVDRSVISYQTGPKWPAQYDIHTVTNGRSWYATYNSDPAHPPTLPANEFYEAVNYGTWMIRGYGATVPISECRPVVSSNHITGAPGSYFTISGAGYPENSTATISVNGNVMGTVLTDNNGEFSFELSTDNSDEGNYVITVSVNPSATTYFSLNTNAPTHSQESSGTVFPVPAGIALDKYIFLPAILR